MKIRGELNKKVISDDLRHLRSENKTFNDPVHRMRSHSNPPLDIKNRDIDTLTHQKVAIPPLASYPLETLQASLKRNEALLNDKRACRRLPDNGKKIVESNALIKQAIQYKELHTKQRSQSVNLRTQNQFNSLPKNPSPLSKETKYNRTKDFSLENQLQDLSLYSNPLASSSSSLFNDTISSNNTSSSSNKLCFSSCTSLSPELPPPKFDPVLKSMSVEYRGRDMPLKLAINLRNEEERIRRENALRYRIRVQNHDKSSTPVSRHFPFFDFVEDDSDDFDGFSEDEYY